MHRSFLFLATVLLLFAGWKCGNQAAGPAPPPPSGPDTTSHDFTWTTYTLGDGQSYLQDVYAVNDTDVWAVGEIYLKDSTGKLNPNMYNVAHWNGKEWTLSRPTYVALNAVYGFGKNDIWAGSSAPYHWNGTNWKVFNVQGIFNGYIRRIWGRATDDLYFIGSHGSIMHYNGRTFLPISSGTNADLTGLWGNANNIWITGMTGLTGIILHGTLEAIFQKISDSAIARIYPPQSVWCNDNDFLLLGGYGVIYRDSSWKFPPDEVLYGGIPGSYYSIHGIHGSAKNNAWIIGDYFYAAHYNGRTWRYYSEILDYPDGSQAGRGVYALSSTVYIVGSLSRERFGDRVGYVLVGKKK